MKTIELQPIKIVPSEFDDLEARIARLFKKEIYAPILKEMDEPSSLLSNSTDDLIEAIRAGRISFYRGHFTGRFSAATSRELKSLGAKWDRKQGSFRVPLGSLPLDVRQAINLSERNFLHVVAKIEKRLSMMDPAEIAGKLKASDLFSSTLFRTNKAMMKSVEGITIMPKLTDEQRERIADEYTENLKLYIKDFSAKEIVKLRETVAKKALQGQRYEGLVKTIQKSYDVSYNKAKFLARQETNLMMTKFKQTRYEDAGVNEYRWGCVAGSPNHPVRPAHKKLEGKTFRWDNPPITDEKGNRNNPGQDYGCRCFARPIVRF